MVENQEKNIISNNEYLGENQVELHQRRIEKNYESALWGTYLQWKQVGRTVKKDEKGTVIFRPVRVKNGTHEDGSERFKSSRKHFNVFNFEQTEVPV